MFVPLIFINAFDLSFPSTIKSVDNAVVIELSERLVAFLCVESVDPFHHLVPDLDLGQKYLYGREQMTHALA